GLARRADAGGVLRPVRRLVRSPGLRPARPHPAPPGQGRQQGPVGARDPLPPLRRCPALSQRRTDQLPSPSARTPAATRGDAPGGAPTGRGL
ncbi:MAG: hypothetical protein AVDCRST_MAG49-3906, partial [uncultured Thermomicrobiales bacterium]